MHTREGNTANKKIAETIAAHERAAVVATEMKKLDNGASAMGGRHLRDLEDRLEEQSAATT